MLNNDNNNDNESRSSDCESLDYHDYNHYFEMKQKLDVMRPVVNLQEIEKVNLNQKKTIKQKQEYETNEKWW